MATFIDEVLIHAKAGDGGNGAVAWHRERFVPRGGPDGGDGGDGGDVVFVADPQMRSLLDYKYRRHLKGDDGEQGRGKNQYGHRGDDAVAKVPVGTQIFDADTEVLIADLKEPGQVEIVCKGGSGGFGNTRFATATRQAPDFAKPGLPGEERNLRLSLKLLADVGLLGFPNAGKSTLLSTVSAARPKIADYPFTTLTPNLGVVGMADGQSFVMADIPGLIEGAAEGHGLGIRFLKHLERVHVICHLIEAPLPHMREELPEGETSVCLHRYLALRNELAKYSEDLANLDEIVVINKTDLIEGDPLEDPDIFALKDYLRDSGRTLYFMSTATGEGIDALKYLLFKHVHADDAPAPQAKYDPLSDEPLP